MSRFPRPLLPILLGLAAIAAAPASLSDPSDPYNLLQAMPRERRVVLSENLDRFDRLDPAEQASIRKLDAEIARKDPVEQARYRALLRRYHLWVNGLTDEQKKELKDAGTAEARFNLARRYRLKEIENQTSGPRLFGIRTGDYGLPGPFEVAHLLKIWNKLPATTKAEIEKHQDRGQLINEIHQHQKTAGIPPEPMPIADEKFYDSRLEANQSFKDQLGPANIRREDAKSKRAEAAIAKGAPLFLKYRYRYPEFLYFEDHKPKAVSQKNLERFSAACPAWLHAMIDSLSPDDARNYLTILYRQLYPEPTEMPAETKPAIAPASTPKPNPKKPGPPGSF